MDINLIYTSFLAYAKANPVVSGVLSLWGLTVLTFFIKTIPIKIKNFIKTQGVTTLELDSGGNLNREIYGRCLNWIFSNNRLHFSRSFSIYTSEGGLGEDWCNKAVVSAGYGNHYFLYKKRFMILIISELDSSASNFQKRKLVLKCVGRNTRILKEFIDEFTPPIKEEEISLLTLDHSTWQHQGKLQRRPIDSIALPVELKNKLLNQIDHFSENEQWFLDVGLPYKLAYILHGIPGTGKTSLVKALSSHYKRNICVINITAMTDTTLQEAFNRVPENSIMLIEDFDSASSTKDRGVQEMNGIKSMVEKNDGKMDFSFLSLTGILNSLDGVKGLHNVIVFLTTNDLQAVDPAIYRKGRVEEIILIEESKAEDIRKYSSHVFPDYDFSKIPFVDVLGCELNSALLQSKGNIEEYIKLLV